MSAPAATLASARLHLETAIALVGRETILEWLTTSGVTPGVGSGITTSTVIRKVGGATTAAAAAATGQRGRKAGILPTPEQRCSWKLNNKEQCSNKKKPGNDFCGLHMGKIQLIDGGSTGGDADDA
jgi:hypothetical protein